MKGKAVLKLILKGLGAAAGVFAGLLLVVQIVLSSGVATSLVDRFVADYVDGNLSFGKVSVNVLARFPAVSVNLEDAVLVYPHDRFESQERRHSDMRALRAGRGEEMDTLASFRKLVLAANVPPLLSGRLDVSQVVLDAPKIYAKHYDDGRANWDMFNFGGSDASDTTSTFIPPVTIRTVELTGHPDVVYCDTKDTLYARLLLRQMKIQGDFNSDDIAGSEGKFTIDSLLIAGKYKADTLAFALDRLEIKEGGRKLSVFAKADARLHTKAFGRFNLPLSLDAEGAFPEDSIFTLSRLEAVLAGIPFSAKGELRALSDRYYVDAEAAVTDFKFNNALRDYLDGVWEGSKEIETDAELNLAAQAEGCWSPQLGLLPSLNASIRIPASKLTHKGYDLTASIAFDAAVETDADSTLNFDISRIYAQIPGLEVDGVGKALDLLGADPVFDVDVDVAASLDSLSRFMPSGYMAGGYVEACLRGKIRQSQLNVAKAARANLSGRVNGDSIWVASEGDSLKAYVNHLDVELAALGDKIDDEDQKDMRMLALLVDADSLSADYGGSISASVTKLHLKAQNSADILDSRKKALFYPFKGELSVGRARLNAADSAMVSLRNSDSEFKISPKKDNPAIPVLKLASKNGRLMFKGTTNRAGARDFSVNATAAMNSLERRFRRRAFLDSLALVYPGVPRDSLLDRHFGPRRPPELPDWLQDESLASGDIKINLSEDIKKYYRDWDLSGDLSVGRAFVSTPYYPLRNTLENLSGSFTNDRIELDSFVFKSGKSDISAQGSLSGLRRVILSKGFLKMDLELKSDVLQFNEMIGAYHEGLKVDEKKLAELEALDDTAYQEACVTEIPDEDYSGSTLIIVPGNVDARLSLKAGEVDYAGLRISSMESEMVMKERCLQMCNTSAFSNVGDIYFEGFYSTKSRKDIKTGFNLNLTDVTADKVIELIPQVDSLVPLLKTFSGLLDCTLAATASLDENMDVLMPTVSGVARITGKELEIRGEEEVRQIARLLKFRNRKVIHVEDMSVEGLLGDSKLEIFPFVLNVDRYKVALSGVQNMDKSFRYHVSVIKSPILFKFGVDLYGDFDKWKFKLGRAKYRNADKIPVFSQQIDQTTVNLTASIHNIFEKGVEAAIAENEAQRAIRDFKDSTHYVAAYDQPLDTLSGREAREIEKYDKMASGAEDLGIDLEKLDVGTFEALDEETKARLQDLGITREWLEKRESDEGAADSEDADDSE